MADEFRKFAPHLTTVMYYGGKQNKRQARDMSMVDVLITTPHKVHEPEIPRQPHRLVLDESHLLDAKNTTAGKLPTLQLYSPRSMWLVTGTPFSTSLGQLTKQAQLLGQYEGGVRVMDLIHGTLRPGHSNIWHGRAPNRTIAGYNRDQMENEQVVAALRKIMIRHTKAMRIGGAVALALPDADCETIWLDMSEDERLLYRVSGCADGAQGAPRSDKLLNGIEHRMRVCAHHYNEEVCRGDYGFVPNQQHTLADWAATGVRKSTSRWTRPPRRARSSRQWPLFKG